MIIRRTVRALWGVASCSGRLRALVERAMLLKLITLSAYTNMKLIVDLIYEAGLGYMRYSVSDTGGIRRLYSWAAHRQPTNARRDEVILSEIQSGQLAKT